MKYIVVHEASDDLVEQVRAKILRQCLDEVERRLAELRDNRQSLLDEVAQINAELEPLRRHRQQLADSLAQEAP